jgi:hypothetical protein
MGSGLTYSDSTYGVVGQSASLVNKSGYYDFVNDQPKLSCALKGCERKILLFAATIGRRT